MDCSKTQRRPGSENGPSQFFKILKYSLLVAINDPFSSYLDCFGFIGSEYHSFSDEAFRARYTSLSGLMKGKDLAICVGGDSSALSPLVSDDIEVIIKISPNLSRGVIDAEKVIDNSNYVSGLPPSTRARIIHFGILDYTNTQKDFDSVVKEDQTHVIYLDKIGQCNAKEFKHMLEKFCTNKKIAVLLDCESLTPDYFPGVSNPSVFGLVEPEIFEMLETLGKANLTLRLLTFANFNPAVESRRSADCLLYMIYSLLQSQKTVGSSVLAALADN